jgi:hypothetical protein
VTLQYRRIPRKSIVVHRTVVVTDCQSRGGKHAMRLLHLSFLVFLFGAVAVSGGDSKPNDFAEFNQVKDAVRRVILENIEMGWDDKILGRSGDLVAIAIVKTIPESELSSPSKIGGILGILHDAFGCPSRCVESLSNRQPNVTMLLLEHLRNHAMATSQAEIDKTREFIVQQTRSTE